MKEKNTNLKIALFPASFNPIHNSHIEIIKESLLNFDKLYVLVANNEAKDYAVLLSERYALIEKAINLYKINNITLIKQQKNQLTPLLAKELNVKYIVRGLKNTDKLTNYEDKLADSYLEYNNDLIFYYVSLLNNDISSNKIRNHIRNNEDISDMVPKELKKDIIELYERY